MASSKAVRCWGEAEIRRSTSSVSSDCAPWALSDPTCQQQRPGSGGLGWRPGRGAQGPHWPRTPLSHWVRNVGCYQQLPQPCDTKNLMVGWGQTKPQSSLGQKQHFLVGSLHGPFLLPTLVTRARHSAPSQGRTFFYACDRDSVHGISYNRTSKLSLSTRRAKVR